MAAENPAVPFRLSFAPLATLKAAMDKDAADLFDRIWDAFPASLARLDESLFHATLHAISILPPDIGHAIADAFAGRPAAIPQKYLEDLPKLFPCRVESSPEAPATLVLSEELRNGWNDAEARDHFAALARTLDLVEYADAAVRLYGALSLDAFFDLLDGYGVSTDILPDILPILVDIHAEFACLRHDFLFHFYFDEMDGNIAHIENSEAPDFPDNPPRIPPDAPVHKIVPALAKKFDVLPHYTPPIDEFLAWARPDWFGNDPDLARALMVIRNSDNPEDDEDAEGGLNLLYCLAQTTELRKSHPKYLPSVKFASDLWQLAEDLASILRLWSLNGYTFEEAEDRFGDFRNAFLDILASAASSPKPKHKKSKRHKRRRR